MNKNSKNMIITIPEIIQLIRNDMMVLDTKSSETYSSVKMKNVKARYSIASSTRDENPMNFMNDIPVSF